MSVMIWFFVMIAILWFSVGLSLWLYAFCLLGLVAMFISEYSYRDRKANGDQSDSESKE